MPGILPRRFLSRPLLAAVLLLLPAFHGVQRTAAQSAPSIRLLAPANGQSVSGPLDVRVQIAGLTLDGTKIGTPPTPGVGHWHVYVDGKYAGLSVSDVVTIPNDAMPQIATGQHEIKVQIHNNDHTPIQPDVTSAVTVNYTQAVQFQPASGSPSIKIVAPAGDAQLSTAQPNVLKVQIAGLKLDGTKIGTPPQQGVGHWHLYVDGKYAGLSVSDSISLPNDAMPQITPGRHEIKVQLHNNDHTPIQPDVTNTVTVNFSAGQPASGGGQPAAQAAAGQQGRNGLPSAGTGGLLDRHDGGRGWTLALPAIVAALLLGSGAWFWHRSGAQRAK